jgi:pimeloyl-ACP methyl ester carboxylesterase
MNFLIRPDAETLLAEDDYRRLWAFFTNMGAQDGPYAWLTDEVKAQYREVWSQGLTGALNYYRASPLRPPRDADAAAAAITLPKSMLDIGVPTLVLWGMHDIALPPSLVDGLEDYIPELTLQRIDRWQPLVGARAACIGCAKLVGVFKANLVGARRVERSLIMGT